MVKEFLSQKGIGFKEHDVSRDRAAAQELQNRTGQMGVPVTVIDGQIIIGFDRERLEQALNMEQQRDRPSFGAAIADASKITARQGLGITLGAYIGNVRPGSVAQRVGLAPGDIITEINMQRVATADDLEQALSKISKGGRIALVFLRGNKTFTTEGAL
jgi:S1-C subfamily serine protease